MTTLEQYHRNELRIALDPNHPAHVLPPALPRSHRVLDIGCGAGQTLVAVYPDRVSFGLDMDIEALKLGKSIANGVNFVCGRAEALPWPDGHFDIVIARVSLNYSNINESLKEIRRVLADDGILWATLCPFSKLWKPHASSYKSWIFYAYVLLNSALFHLVQKQFSFFGKYESFQTERGIGLALKKAGFEKISISRKEHFVVTARRV